MKRVFLFILLLQTLLSATDIINIKQCKQAYNIGSNLSYLADKNNNLTIEEIQHKKFTSHTKKIPNFGFLAPTYWFKFQVTFDADMTKKQWWLNIDYPLLDFVDLYAYDSANKLVLHKKNGDLYAAKLKDTKQNKILFSLPKKPQELYTFYMKVVTTGSMFVPIQIVSNDKLLQNVHLTQTISGMYYGILLILILYSTITFFYTKESIYMKYVLFIFSYALWQLSFDGLGNLYFWENIKWLKEKDTIIFIFTSTFTLILFSQAILKVDSNIPRYNRYVLTPIKTLAVVGFILAIIFPYKYTIISGALISIIAPVFLFIAGLIVLKKDYYSIRFFVAGWGIFLIATLLFTLSKFNLVYGYAIMKYGQQIGSAIDMVLLSVALVYRVKELQNEYTKKLENQTKELAAQVKTALLKERQKDQLLIEKSKLASLGEMIEQIAHQWRQPLNNIGLINQDIYFKKELGTLTDSDFEKLHSQIDVSIEYLSKTIDDFRNYYKSAKEEETYLLSEAIHTVLHITEATLKYHKINITLELDKSLKVHNIKSEFFQVLLNILNNAKDALLSNNIVDKKILIKLTHDNNNALLSILDNGGGVSQKILSKLFDPYFTTKADSKGTGIGLYMSQNIIEQHMHGNLEVANKLDGACFKITLPLYNKRV